MSDSKCECKIGCTGLAIIASIIVGIITAILRYTAIITVTPAFLWVLFGVAVGFLGITLLSSTSCCSEKAKCCCIINQLMYSILGTVLTSVILLGVSFAATSVIGAIISGLLLFFFSLTIISTTCLIRCICNCI